MSGTHLQPSPAGVDDVLTLLRGRCAPLGTQRVPVGEARGRVLREAVLALEDQPPFDRSSMDGFAVRMDDRSAEFRIVDDIRAGDWKPRSLARGEAVRMATGGALPGDGLKVVMREDAEVSEGRLTVRRPQRERNIRVRGEDALRGQVLVEAGTVLHPGGLALLASVGCAEPLVTRLPRVLHVATGNELVNPAEAPGPGQIRDSNSTLVRAFLGQWGVVPKQIRVPEDEAAAIATVRRVRPSVPRLDLVLFSGGASVGEHDFTRRLLERFGFTIHVSKVASRPGKPLIVAQRGSTLAFGLPGNPLAHFVCLNLFVRVALEALAGRSGEATPLFRTGVLEADLSVGDPGRETFWPARWTFGPEATRLAPLRWSNSGDLTSLATANALIRLAAGTRRLERGARVQYVATEDRE